MIIKIIYAYLKRLFSQFTSLKTRRKIVLFYVNLKRFYYQRKGRKIIHFIHLGKTGGSAIKTALKGNNLINQDYALLTHSHTIRLKDIPKGEKIIFFVRDPLARFVSGFNSIKAKGKPAHFDPWTKDERLAFKTFGSANELAVSLSSKDSTIQKAAEQAMKSIYHVKSSFWDWFENEKYLSSRIDDLLFVGRQENLNKDFTKMCQKLGINEKVHLPTKPDKMNKSINQESFRLNNQAKRNLKKWYQRDYQFLTFLEKRKIIN